MAWLDYLPDSARQELEELRRAPVGAAVLLILGVGIGWWGASLFYAERFQVMEQRLTAAQESLTIENDFLPGINFPIQMGAGTDGCDAEFDGRYLLEFRDQYDVALVCGVSDKAVDRFKSTQIAVSPAFTIHPGEMHVIAHYSRQISQALGKQSAESFNNNRRMSLGFWYELVLLPKSLDVSQVRMLSDVVRLGGKQLSLGVTP